MIPLIHSPTVKRLRSELIILFISKIGNDIGLSIGRFGVTSDVKRLVGEFRIWLVSKVGTDGGIWPGDSVGLTVDKIEGYIIRAHVGTLFSLSLRKNVESLLEITLVSGKLSV